MSSPFATYPVPERSFIPASTPSTPAPARGGAPAARGTGAKRGRKPKNANANANANASATANTSANAEIPRAPSTQPSSSQAGLPWLDPQLANSSSSQPAARPGSAAGSSTPAPNQDAQSALLSQGLSLPGTQASASTPGAVGESGTPGPSGTGAAAAATATGAAAAGEEDGDGEDEMLPAMADDDYSAQLSWQSQSKDNLKCVSDAMYAIDETQ